MTSGRWRSSGLWLGAYAAVIVLAWEVAVRAARVPHYILPAPSSVGRELVSEPLLLLSHAWVTLYEMVAGFLLGTLFGVALAVIIAFSPLARTLLMPTVIAIQSVPKVAVAPLFVVWFGLGLASKLVLVVTVAFFPVLMNTLAGLTSVDADMIDLVRGMGGSKRQMLFKIRIPYAVPYVFGGMKIAVPLAMIGAIVGEFIASERGLGNLILSTSQNLRTSLNFASLILISAVSSAMYQAVDLSEKLVLRWMPQGPKG